MSKTIFFSAIAVTALAGAAFLDTAEPVAAKDYEFCSHDHVTNTRKCSYHTMEQCVAALFRLPGSCERDPFFDGGSSFAYAPKGHGRPQR